MLIGFNNDVEYRGKTFHIQTEDHGDGDPRIETQLFYSGAILDTVITSYQEILDEYDGDEAKERIRAQMKASHRSLFKKLKAGEYDEFAGLEPLEDADEPEAEAEDFTPSQDRVPAAAARVEEEGEDAILEFQKKKAKSHVSLDKLKDQLSNLSVSSDDSEPEEVDEQAAPADDDVAPTQVIDAAAGGFEFTSVSEDGGQAAKPAPPTAKTPSAAAEPALVDWQKTGAKAWQGCKPAADDLSLTDLVEEFLGL